MMLVRAGGNRPQLGIQWLSTLGGLLLPSMADAPLIGPITVRCAPIAVIFLH